MAEWTHLSTPDPEWVEVLTKSGGLPTPFKDTDLVSRRNVFHELMRKRVEGMDESTRKRYLCYERIGCSD